MPSSRHPELRPMEFRFDRRRRIVGSILFALLYLAVCAAICIVFVWFTGSVGIAIGFALFMGGYMWFASRLTMRNIERRSDESGLR